MKVRLLAYTLSGGGGGVIVGIVIAPLVISFRRRLRNCVHSTYNAQIMLFLITPFIIYFFAKKLGVSGIITVVCAGRNYLNMVT